MNTTTAFPSLPGDIPSKRASRRATAGLALLALGVVYGDIGTSPLYAAKETFDPARGIRLTPENILGGCSAIFWTLMIVVSLKYVTLVLRATNRGEGGIMALLALVLSAVRDEPRLRALLLIVGVAGASLFYGDAVLTPAISVLSAVEGLEIATVAFKPYVVPIAVGILVALFAIQRFGTGTVGMLFGPVCLLWFGALAASGAWNIAQSPEILGALNPAHAWHFVTAHGAASFLVLGSVLLAVTGAEALYADAGHFGARAIRLAWFGVAAPSLVLNYFGQGALLLRAPDAVANPFYLSFPEWALYPMIVLATAATVIASQATISGAYSLTQQAVQLGFLPRLTIRHTSARTVGQIYVPVVNWVLLAVVAAAVVGFGSSSRLAAAYGISVMGTMFATTLLTFFVIRDAWRYPLWICFLATGFFLLVDGVLFAAASHKILDGGWFPLVLGAVVFFLMTTWRQGRARLLARIRSGSPPLEGLLQSLLQHPPHRCSGTAVFFTATPEVTPSALLHSLKHYQVLHERNLFVTVEFADTPFVEADERIASEAVAPDCWRLRLRFGFMEAPDVADALSRWSAPVGALDLEQVSYFLSREKIVTDDTRGLTRWRKYIFAAMARNAGSVSDYFGLPPNRVVELGSRVRL